MKFSLALSFMLVAEDVFIAYHENIWRNKYMYASDIDLAFVAQATDLKSESNFEQTILRQFKRKTRGYNLVQIIHTFTFSDL